jgi:hypothetical protein
MDWKGTGGLGQTIGFHCISVSMYLVPSPSLCFLIAFGFTRDFLWGNEVKGQIVLLFWCLMLKGEKLRPKQLDQLPLVYFSKIYSVRILVFFIKTLLLQKPLSCGGEIRLWEKGGVFGTWSNLVSQMFWFAKTSVFDIEIGKWICFMKSNQVVERVIQICQILC